MFLAILVLSLLLSWFSLVSGPLTVREPLETDVVRGRYFMIPYVEGAGEDIAVRNIAVVEGTFANSTLLKATLVVVRSGKVERQSGLSAGRSSGQFGGPWKKMKIMLAIGESQTADGRRIYFGSYGASSAAGSTGFPVRENAIVTRRLLSGPLARGRECILYVEGSQDFHVARNMSVEEFAQNNPGEFTVVVARVD